MLEDINIENAELAEELLSALNNYRDVVRYIET